MAYFTMRRLALYSGPMKIIRQYLKLTGMKQIDLATKLGIDAPHLNNVLAGRVEAGPKLIKQISETTGIKIEKLIESAAA